MRPFRSVTDIVAVSLPQRPLGLLRQEVGKTYDGIERRAEFVAHSRQEFALQATCSCQFLILLRQTAIRLPNLRSPLEDSFFQFLIQAPNLTLGSPTLLLLINGSQRERDIAGHLVDEAESLNVEKTGTLRIDSERTNQPLFHLDRKGSGGNVPAPQRLLAPGEHTGI